MRKSLLLYFALLLNWCVCGYAFMQTPAFPGAGGHGRFTTGGRGGNVFYVTNLSDENIGNATTREGSLRWCLSQAGAKTILFKVSGTIFLKSNLSVSVPNLTIAGQSAPGDGICIAGFPVSIGASNVIIRFVRMRMGSGLNTNADGADALGARKIKNIMIDHCSMSWSTDECVSIYENENTTLQWCIIAESLRLSSHSKGAHGYGGIWGGVNASFHHNLVAHHDSRTPRFGPGATTQLRENTDMRNCVIYNWTGNGVYGGEAMKVNVVNNYYKPGPGTPTGSKRARIVAIDKKTNLGTTDSFYPINNMWGKWFIDGNVVDASTSTGTNATHCNNATTDNWLFGVYNQFASGYGTVSTADRTTMRMSEPWNAGVVTTHTAAKAYEKVLAWAGASLRRDSHDQRIVDETRNGTATYKGLSSANVSPYPKPGIIDSQFDLKPAGAGADWSPWPALTSVEAPADTNRDGIPDGWLEAHFPGKTSNDLNDEGYTYLEVYLNSLVQHIINEQEKEAIISGVSTAEAFKYQLVTYVSADMNLVIHTDGRVRNVEIFDLAGVLRAVSNQPESPISMAGFAAGIYLIRVFFENGKLVQTSRLVF